MRASQTRPIGGYCGRYPMTLVLTANEVDLLRETHRVIAPIVANSEMTDHVRTSMCGGGNGRFSYRVRGNKLTGWWPSQWQPEREVSIALTRVRKWADSLPDELRARALVAWRVYPVNTRDIPALYRITLEAIGLQGRHAPAPGEQLDLFQGVS
ncbi:hypothetical protein SEA_EYRE_54 [Gordonia phage Eyre]|uniref:Uncharacterized protein n=1 Tax=Gordonia phage Eyre TaxID=1887646 RepID=A0A1B3B009_9CAUD|nr:hypothetical protein BIZ73_gp54 [Gordonia phage Eyre]AOE44334.1 hypothetical protein SEA_EYRE_54 [Gordonia phage Eyre]